MKKILCIILSLLIYGCESNNESRINNNTDSLKIARDSSKKERIKSPITSNKLNLLDEFLKTIYPNQIWANLEVMDTLGGDLNLDGHKDYLIIFKEKQEDTCNCDSKPPDGCLECCPRRILKIFLHQDDKDTVGIEKIKLYYLSKSNDKIVYTKCSGGYVLPDPYQRLFIKDGYFSVEHYGKGIEHFTRITTFKFNKEKNDWLLYKDGGVSFHYLDRDKEHKEVVRTIKDFGDVAFEEFDYTK